MAMPTQAELLSKASRCYLAAGWADEACRCFEVLGNHPAAGRLHEQGRRFELAAFQYELAQDWQGAARCYLSLGQPDRAGDALIKAGDLLHAAWILAEHAHLFERARNVLAGFASEVETQQLAADLVLARCEAGRGAFPEAARRLARASLRLSELRPAPERGRVEDWALAVGEALARWDLIAQIHAAAVTAGVLGAVARWEAWALKTFNDTTGIPVIEDKDPLAEPAESETSPSAPE
jgi:tetratricopeptide (TPR) repeat protein